MTKKSSTITIRDIAKYADVSIATVSRYLNHSGPVSKEVGERISQLMLELNYTPHAVARQLATQRTRSVGLVITNVMNDFFSPLVNGIFSVTTGDNYNLLVAVSRPGLGDNSKISSQIGPHNTDGMLVFADGLTEDQLAAVCKNHYPVILLYRTPPAKLNIPYVAVENRTPSRILVDHLIEVHHRKRIIFMKGPKSQEDSYWREKGYRESLLDHGIPIDDRLFLYGNFEHQIAYQALRNRLANSKLDFDAVFSGNDDCAVGVLNALDEFGIRVPEDVSVVGFDDFRLAPFLNPPLTTVRAPTEKVGKIAATQLTRLFQGLPIEQKILLPTEIVIRRSCGCEYKKPSQTDF
jgi:LacI family transcriptional regulator